VSFLVLASAKNRKGITAYPLYTWRYTHLLHNRALKADTMCKS
jgi:hypothetical protein